MRDEGASADQALIANLGSIEHHSPHADEAEIANSTGVNDRRVADRAIRTDHSGQIIGEVDHRTVLHICPLPDLDRFDISPENGSVENTRVPPEPHITNERRVRGDKRRERGFGLASEEFVKALVDRHKRGRIWLSIYFLRFASAMSWASASIQSDEGSPGQPIVWRRSPI